MDMESQQYCLRWNNHRSNLLTVFEQLLQTEAFTDVTLAVNGTSIKCHKMVLAACSSYFQSLFLENACPHPIVVFKDIQYAEIRAILEYMYRGEVNVAQEQLPSLLKVAEALRVKGLFEDDSVSGTHTHTHTHSLSSSIDLPNDHHHHHHHHHCQTLLDLVGKENQRKPGFSFFFFFGIGKKDIGCQTKNR